VKLKGREPLIKHPGSWGGKKKNVEKKRKKSDKKHTAGSRHRETGPFQRGKDASTIDEKSWVRGPSWARGSNMTVKKKAILRQERVKRGPLACPGG